MAEKFFLFLGNFSKEGLRSKLNLAEVWYETKILESSPGNWEKVIDLLNKPDLIGVVGKFGRQVYSLLSAEAYSNVGPDLLEALSRVPHMIFIHEDILTGAETAYPFVEWTMSMVDGTWVKEHKSETTQLPQECTDLVNNLLQKYEIQATAYRKNSELFVMADAFVSDLENNLLFRLYVPSGRIYANEMSRLLDLFREWLTSAKGEKIRQDGYKTSRGQVFEFFSERKLSPEEMTAELREFNRFLDLCQYPEEAARLLNGLGVTKEASEDIVRRYSKEVRRLQVDIRQERENRTLQIMHRLESELVDETNVNWSDVRFLVSSMVPGDPSSVISPVLPAPSSERIFSPNIQINQQIIENSYSHASQNIAGSQNFGPDAQTLIGTILKLGGSQEVELIASVHEVADAEARSADRLTAKQKLKSFLLRQRDNIESTAYGIAQTYLESQMGM